MSTEGLIGPLSGDCVAEAAAYTCVDVAVMASRSAINAAAIIETMPARVRRPRYRRRRLISTFPVAPALLVLFMVVLFSASAPASQAEELQFNAQGVATKSRRLGDNATDTPDPTPVPTVAPTEAPVSSPPTAAPVTDSPTEQPVGEKREEDGSGAMASEEKATAQPSHLNTRNNPTTAPALEPAYTSQQPETIPPAVTTPSPTENVATSSISATAQSQHLDTRENPTMASSPEPENTSPTPETTPPPVTTPSPTERVETDSMSTPAGLSVSDGIENYADVEAEALTKRPTRAPTLEPTQHPTPQPTRKPTTKPTPQPQVIPTTPPPTRKPTPNPTPTSTSNPTPDPTTKPTRKPTAQPTRKPSVSPTRTPTPKPTLAAQNAPTRTSKPTRKPTESPIIAPTTKKPTPKPTRKPSLAPTTSMPNVNPGGPTPTLTKRPTAIPTERPTQSSSANPTMSTQRFRVKAKMNVDDCEKLVGNSVSLWEEVTEQQIHGHLNWAVEIGMEKFTNLEVSAKIKRQIQRAEEEVAADSQGDINSRFLKEKKPLTIIFVANISFQSPKQHTHESVELFVGNSFDSEDDQGNYINALHATNDESFFPMNSIMLEFKTVPVPESNGPNVHSDNDGDSDGDKQTNSWLIVGPLIGGAFVLAGAAYFVWTRRRTTKKEALVTTAEDKRISTFIEVDECKEIDMSTLDNPGAGGGRDKHDPDKVYGKKTTGSYGLERVATIPGIAGVTSVGSTLLEDDQFYVKKQIIKVDAPAGKLGAIIDTPQIGGIPVVIAIKDTSVLVDKIQVGDGLISVDNVDTTQLSAIEVSKLMSERAENPSRILIFTRRCPATGTGEL